MKNILLISSFCMLCIGFSSCSNENDEFVQATVIEPDMLLADGDSVLNLNFRADRAREITQALLNEDFDGFARLQRRQCASGFNSGYHGSSTCGKSRGRGCHRDNGL